MVNEQELGRERAQPMLTPAHRLVPRKDDSCWAACGGSDVIFVAHVKGPHRRAMLRTEMEEGLDIAFSPDGRKLLAGGVPAPSAPRAAPPALCDVEDRRLLREYEALPSRQVTAVAYLPAGDRALAACGEDNVVRTLAIEEGRETATLAGHSAKVNRLVFLPDGDRALTASDDNSVRLWSLESGDEIRQFEGHIKPVRCLDVSCDGRYVLSGGMDGLCCIWEIESGELISYTLPGSSPTASAQFNRDSRFITVITRHWSLYQWRVPTLIERTAAGEQSVIEPRAR